MNLLMATGEIQPMDAFYYIARLRADDVHPTPLEYFLQTAQDADELGTRCAVDPNWIRSPDDQQAFEAFFQIAVDNSVKPSLLSKLINTRFTSKLPFLGPLDILATVAASPAIYMATSDKDQALRRVAYASVENIGLNPVALSLARRLILKGPGMSAKVALGSTVILIPLAVAESFAEDSIEEYIRGTTLNQMGVVDIKEDALRVMSRTAEGWADFFWNPPDRRGTKSSVEFRRVYASYFAELYEEAARSRNRELHPRELEELAGEAEKRTNRILTNAIDWDIGRIKSMNSISGIQAAAAPIAEKLNSNPEFTLRYGRRIYSEEIMDLAIASVEEDQKDFWANLEDALLSLFGRDPKKDRDAKIQLLRRAKEWQDGCPAGTPAPTGCAERYPVGPASSAACVYQAFLDSGYRYEVRAEVRAGTLAQDDYHCNGPEQDPAGWLGQHPGLYSDYPSYFAQ